MQLDFNLPERFNLEYNGADNAPHRPIMLHRVLVGSMERFVGGLIEHYAGAFPVWLAPEQVRVIPISDETADAARCVYEQLRGANLRVHLDDRAQTLNYRIREAETLKIPYMAVIGKREAEAGQVACAYAWGGGEAGHYGDGRVCGSCCARGGGAGRPVASFGIVSGILGLPTYPGLDLKID